jgi:hypothetical protein
MSRNCISIIVKLITKLGKNQNILSLNQFNYLFEFNLNRFHSRMSDLAFMKKIEIQYESLKLFCTTFYATYKNDLAYI